MVTTANGTAPAPASESPASAGGGVPRPSGIARSATTSHPPPPAAATAAAAAAHREGHGSHRRVYSAVEGSLAQQALLEGTAGLVLDLGGMSGDGGDGNATSTATATTTTTSTGGSGQGDQKAGDKDAAGVSSWNELAQAQGALLKSDRAQQARQEREAALFVQDALVDAAAEEDVEVVSSPKAVDKAEGERKIKTVMEAAGGGAGGAPPSSDKSEGTPTHSDDHRYLATTPKTGTGGLSVTSSTRSIPGSLVRPSGMDTAGGRAGAGATAASRAYSDIIEDLKADHRDTEDLEGLSIGYDGAHMMDDDENNSIISGVTTWMPLADASGASVHVGGGGGGGDDNRSVRSGTSRKGGTSTSRRGKRLDDETAHSPPPSATTGAAAAAAVGVSEGLTSSLFANRRSSAASSKDGGDFGYVSSSSGGAVSNDAFLQAMRTGSGAGAGGAAAHQHRVTASSVTDRASGGNVSVRKSALRYHHQHHPHGRAQSPRARDTQSPLSLEELPVTPTRTGGSSQGPLSTLGTAGGGIGAAAPFAADSAVAAAPSANSTAAVAASAMADSGGGGGGTSDLLLSAINDLRGHVDRTLDGVRDQNRSDFEKVLAIMQNESSKRSALESRLHAQLLLQSEAMVAMEMKLLRLEASEEGKGKQGQHAHHHQQQNQHRTGTTGSGSAGPPVSVLRESGFSSGGPIVSSLPPISSDRPYEEEDLGSLEDGGVPRAVRASRAFAASGASLASAVTDGFTVDDASTKSERDESTAQGEDGGDVSVDGSDSTAPTFSSRHRTLDSILMDPEIRGEVSVHGTSTRAMRGSDDGDGDSTLATSMTSTTRGSTVLTGVSTRAGESINVRALSGLSEANEYDHGGSEDEENPSTYGIASSPANDELSQRSTSSRSPLTVQSRETAASVSQSIASHSVAASHISTAVVAPHRSRAYRRVHDRAAIGTHTRPLANRLVQFTTTPAEPTDGADEVTVPDELVDNASDVAETFARSANQWREEYEARLDAIQKRYGSEPGEGR